MSEDRIAKLSQRFTKHSLGHKPFAPRSRERRSFYMASDLTERIDRIYQEVNHELYPHPISKSLFLETIIEFGLDNVDDLKPLLLNESRQNSNSAIS